MRHSFFFYILDMFNTLRAHGCWLCALFFSFSLLKKNFFSLQIKKNRLYSPINKNPVNTGLYRHPKNFPFGCIDWTVFTKDNSKSLPRCDFPLSVMLRMPPLPKGARQEFLTYDYSLQRGRGKKFWHMTPHPFGERCRDWFNLMEILLLQYHHQKHLDRLQWYPRFFGWWFRLLP